MSRQSEASRTDAETTTPGGGRLSAGERREQIVRVAMQLFSERGFRGTTTKEIAQAAGVSEAIIFRHFATKDELYTAIIDFKSCSGMGAGLGPQHRHDGAGEHPVVETIRCAVGEAMGRGDDRALFSGIALAMMEHHQRDPQFLRLLLFSALEGHQLSQMFWDRNVRVMYEFLGGYIRERQRAGAFRDVDPFVVVRAFIGAVIHHSLNNTLWDRDTARRILNIENEEAARQFTEILLRGVEAERPGASAPKRGGEPTKRAASKVKGKKKN